MAINRKTPTSAVDGPTSGVNYGIGVDEEVAALWRRISDNLNTIGGTANAITGASEVTLAAYGEDNQFVFIPTATNTGAATINIDTVGVADIVDVDGNALSGGEILTGRLTLIRYDGANFRIMGAISVSAAARGFAVFYNGQTQGTAGGPTTIGSDVIYTLNSTEVNTLSGVGVSLSANQFTLPVGEWEIEFVAPFNLSGVVALQVHNVTDVLTESTIGANFNSPSTTNASVGIRGTLVVTGSAKVFEIRYRVTVARAVDGLGNAQNIAGRTEEYGVLVIRPSIGAIAATSVPTTRNINTAAPFTGGGDLSADRTIDMDIATADAPTDISPSDLILMKDVSAAKNVKIEVGDLQGEPGSSLIVATSVTSVTIDSGAKVFTIQDDRGFGIGAQLIITSDADPADFMQGSITTYTGTTLTMNITRTGGSGAHTDWTINLVGLAGLNGESGGLPYTFDDAIAMVDPGAGDLRFNNATLGSVTAIAISDNSAAFSNPDISGYMLTWDDSTSTINGYLIVRELGSGENFIVFQLDSIADNTGWLQLTGSVVASSGTLVNLDSLQIEFYRTGDKGTTGSTGSTGAPGVHAAFQYNFDTGTADADPGSGNIRFNNATLASVTQAFIDNLDANAADISAFLDTLDDSTSTIKAKLHMVRTDAPVNYAIYDITGTIVDGTGYRKITLTHLDSNGSFGAADPVAIRFPITGDKGATGSTGSTGAPGLDGEGGGLPYTFSDTITMVDPGPGLLRFNNATLGSATSIAIDDLSAAVGNPDISAYINTWDDSTSLVKGYLIIRKLAAAENVVVFQIDSLADNAGWSQITGVAVLAAGSFTDADVLQIEFSRTGDLGTVEGSGGGSSVLPPQLFNPDAAGVAADTDDFTLSSANSVVFVSLNGQVLDDSEYSLTSTTLTVTPDNGFTTTADEVLVFQHEFALEGAGLTLGYTAKTSNYNVLTADHTVDCTANSFTVTLLAAATAEAGKQFVVKNSGSGVITVEGNGAETIDGDLNILLGPGDAIFVESDNTNYKIISLKRAVVVRESLIINGGFQHWQRGTSIAVAATTLVYTADRFLARPDSASATTVSRQTGLTDSSQYSARVQRDSGQTGLLTRFEQPFETADIFKYLGKKVTVSFDVKKGANYSPTSDILDVVLYTGTGAESSRASTGFTGEVLALDENATITASVQRFSFTTSAIIATNTRQMALQFQAVWTGTAGADDWFEIDNIKIESGEIASPFGARSIGEELALCQRYYQLVDEASGVWDSTTTVYVGSTYQTEMRGVPTVGLIDTSPRFRRAGANITGTTLNFSNPGVRGVSIEVTGFSAGTAGEGTTYFDTTGALLSLDAEL